DAGSPPPLVQRCRRGLDPDQAPPRRRLDADPHPGGAGGRSRRRRRGAAAAAGGPVSARDPTAPARNSCPGALSHCRSQPAVNTLLGLEIFDGGIDLTVSEQQLWGGETAKAVDNFPVSGERVPVPVVRWLGRIKGAAAEVNGELGELDGDVAGRIADAGRAIAEGEHDDQFTVDVFQTGSGTSSNMNANEVIANLAGGETHANDHVNMGQSSNDVFPSAVHLAALDEVTHDLLPAMGGLEGSLEEKSQQFADVVKAGRTHLMDAVPVTLGQEFGGYAAQVRLGVQRVEATLRRVGQIPLGGTATGTGLNTHPEFAAKVRERLAADTGLAISEPLDPFEAQGNRDALVELSVALEVYAVSLNKIANDLALMGSGPRAGLAELRLPELQKGSSIMPGKVNPVIPEVVIQVAGQVIGNDAGITIGGMQGQFELNVRVPLIARNLPTTRRHRLDRAWRLA